jgi:hypothetical protein
MIFDLWTIRNSHGINAARNSPLHLRQVRPSRMINQMDAENTGVGRGGAI